MSELKIVAVTFLDSTTYDYWATAEDVAKTECKVCVAVGVLVKKDSKNVKVALLSSAGTQGQTSAFSNWVDIPAACVLSIKVIKEGKSE